MGRLRPGSDIPNDHVSPSPIRTPSRRVPTLPRGNSPGRLRWITGQRTTSGRAAHLEATRWADRSRSRSAWVTSSRRSRPRPAVPIASSCATTATSAGRPPASARSRRPADGSAFRSTSWSVPCAGGFVYSERELAVMRRDIEAAKALGASGVVLGILDEQGCVDRDRTARCRQRWHGRCPSPSTGRSIRPATRSRHSTRLLEVRRRPRPEFRRAVDGEGGLRDAPRAGGTVGRPAGRHGRGAVAVDQIGEVIARSRRPRDPPESAACRPDESWSLDPRPPGPGHRRGGPPARRGIQRLTSVRRLAWAGCRSMAQKTAFTSKAGTAAA